MTQTYDIKTNAPKSDQALKAQARAAAKQAKQPDPEIASEAVADAKKLAAEKRFPKQKATPPLGENRHHDKADVISEFCGETD